MVVHAYYPFDPRVEREARMLTRAGHEVDVVCLRAEGERPFEVVEGVRVHRLALARHRGVGIIRQLLEYVAFFGLALAKVSLLHERRRYGVVQLHNLPDFLVFAGTLAKLRGARLLLDLHDLTPEFYASKFRSGMASLPVRLVRVQERASTGFADHVLTVTELWRQSLIDRGVPADKVDVVMNVADAHIFAPEARSERAADGTLLVIYHGTVTHRYGLDVVVRAIDRIREQAPVRLIIHGSGEYVDELRALVSSLDLAERVTFSGDRLSTTDLARLIGTADLGIVPNRSDVFTDGILPTKLMEYAAVGIPAIASRTPAIEQYFDDDMVRFVRPGSVDDVAEALLELHADPGERQRLALAIRRFAEEQSYERQAETYLRVVEDLHRRGR
jgi:glycosyltransferase involved in cell wall biosynthesis